MSTSFSKLYHPHAGDWVLVRQSGSLDAAPHVYQILESAATARGAGYVWPPWRGVKARRYHREGDDELPTASSVDSDELVLGQQDVCDLKRIVGRCFVACADTYKAWIHYSVAPDSVLWDPELPIFFCRRKLNYKSQTLTGMLAQGWASSTCTDATAPAEKVQWKRVREEEAEASVKKAKLDLEEKAAAAQKAKDDAAAAVEAHRKRKQSNNEILYWMALRFVPKPGAMLPVETAASIFKEDAEMFTPGLEWGQATVLLSLNPSSLLRPSYLPNFFLNACVREAPIWEEFVKWFSSNYHRDPTSCVLAKSLFQTFKASLSYGGELYDDAFVDNLVSLLPVVSGPVALQVDSDYAIVGIKRSKPCLPNPTSDSVAATHTGPHPTPTPVENSSDSALTSSSSPSSSSTSTHNSDAATSPAPSSPSAIHLSKLDLPSFIDHMSKVDPSRAKHYQAALPILDDALVAPDVMAALGADKLEALGLKMGLVRRMLGEPEGRC